MKWNVIKKRIKVEYRGHRTCSRIRGKIVPKVRLYRRCRTEWVPDVRLDARLDARLDTQKKYTEEIHRRNTQKKYTEEIHGMYDG
jgi:hypothetical protein